MKPLVRILTTGGTIATRSGERGAAVMNFKVESLASQLGVLDVEVEMKSVMQKGSMNIVPSDWEVLAKATAGALTDGVDGVVILHGTDTMHYTAAALSFMLRDLSVPVVLTGSMIPGGDPGSDSLPNLRDAITVAAFGDIAEICIVFSRDLERSGGMIIRGCRARKIHSYAINAFGSINISPLGYVTGSKISYENLERKKKASRELKFSDKLDPNVVLIKLNPTITILTLARFLEGASGAVLEGTGVGHVRTDLQGVVASYKHPVAMSTQAIYGGERLGMYDADKMILGIGNLIPTRDMNSETALVKLMWALGQEGNVKSNMLTNIAGEIT